jgi:hypothetical protein
MLPNSNQSSNMAKENSNLTIVEIYILGQPPLEHPNLHSWTASSGTSEYQLSCPSRVGITSM